MEFNPSKCQILWVTLKHKPVEASYTIHGQTLESVESAKYLCVTIDSKLNFSNHIDSVAKKANGTRAFLNHNLRSCSQRVRDSTYKMYIRPMVEYALVLLRFQNVSCRSVSVDFAEKTSVFGSV